ncbi:TLD domain-containing protein 1 isoform X2 [Agrilus planipennis]|uniref:MTOR-associated protein MEAK7 n=1 Tax=Agrilus planipennis TaxID=224129 RepID=A0A1W4XNV9_AGRPL|nr:TLD domain-containing protein 1 isoform X2 [Agrilus planipennis]
MCQKDFWGSRIDERLFHYISNYLFNGGNGSHHSDEVQIETFKNLFICSVRGTVDEKLDFIKKSIGNKKFVDGELPYNELKEFVDSIVSSYVQVQNASKNRDLQSWHFNATNPQSLVRFSESILEQFDQNCIGDRALEGWIQTATLFAQLQKLLFYNLFGAGVSKSHDVKDPHMHGDSDESVLIGLHKNYELLPRFTGPDLPAHYKSLLDISQMIFLNAHLPQENQNEWRLLFSTDIHGESFSTLIGKIMNQGATVIIVEDNHGHIFGGFTPVSWAMKPKFYGDSGTFLFTLVPKMKVYHSTGYNDHYQYLCLNQQTLPNGLGMGGQFHYWGLWLDHDFGHGQSSESCTTFSEYSQLSNTKNFRIKNIDVWGVGMPEEVETTDEAPAKSVLDTNIETKAVLQLAGRKIHSEGIREESN